MARRADLIREDSADSVTNWLRHTASSSSALEIIRSRFVTR
jgi:hypothetical protein